jgi:hypothetical protein
MNINATPMDAKARAIRLYQHRFNEYAAKANVYRSERKELKELLKQAITNAKEDGLFNPADVKEGYWGQLIQANRMATNRVLTQRENADKRLRQLIDPLLNTVG